MCQSTDVQYSIKKNEKSIVKCVVENKVRIEQYYQSKLRELISRNQFYIEVFRQTYCIITKPLFNV